MADVGLIVDKRDAVLLHMLLEDSSSEDILSSVNTEIQETRRVWRTETLRVLEQFINGNG